MSEPLICRIPLRVAGALPEGAVLLEAANGCLATVTAGHYNVLMSSEGLRCPQDHAGRWQAKQSAEHLAAVQGLERLVTKAVPQPLRAPYRIVLRAFGSRFGSGQKYGPGGVESICREQLTKGLFVTEDCLHAALRSAVPEPRAQIDTVGIITRARPEAIERSVRGCVSQARRRDRPTRILVVDGAAPGTEADGSIACLRAISEELVYPIEYCGPQQKTAIVRELSVAGIPEELARFALFGPGFAASCPGANRNTLQLATHGESAISIDDDVILRLLEPVDHQAGIRFASRSDPRDFSFFHDRAGAIASLRSSPRDVFQMHEDLLGQPAAGSFHSKAESTLADDMSEGLCGLILSGGGRIRITTNSLAGQSGMSFPTRFMFMEGVSRERLLASDAVYRSACAAGEVTRLAPQKIVCDSDFCMGTFYGFDNRTFLPPYMPAYRNQDGFFGTLLHMVDPNTLTAYLPETLVHSPIDERVRDPFEIRRYFGLHLCHALQLICRSIALPDICTTAEERASLLSDRILTLADNRSNFERYMKMLVFQKTEILVWSIDQLLARHNRKPDYWAEDVAHYRASVLRSATGPSSHIPVDLWTDDPRVGWENLVRSVTLFGRLLGSWSTIHKTIGELRGAGFPLACPL